MPEETVGQLAELYLGNILYAIERAALSLDAEGQRDAAAFYRAIARKLADAHGRARGGGRADTGEAGDLDASDPAPNDVPRGAY
jgi:hypothetical protein